MKMTYFRNNFWGEKNVGFDVLYHNMKHGQIATKELAEFVRERAAIEETYSKSMSKLAKMASNGSPLGTFAPMWDVFRVSSDKLALCHLELMRKMNDLIRDINKYGEEQVKVHRKTKEEVMCTLEAVQALQVQNGHLQKAREGYHTRFMELERLRKEGAPQKELEKAELKSKKSAEVFAASIEKYNRAGGEFEQKMSDSAQKFQDIEETHLQHMKQLIKAYSHSTEDTHVQVGQVHEEFKQNVENIAIGSLIQKFTEQKGTGKDRPAPVGFEEYLSSQVSDNKKSRTKAFRIPGLGKRDKEPDSTDSVLTDAPNSPLEVDDEGFVIRTDVTQNGCAEKETNFYSSDSDFDDEEPKKFHIQIRPVASGNHSNSAASELELKATVGALTLPLNRAVSKGGRTQVAVKRHLSRNSSTVGRSEVETNGAPHRNEEQEGLRRSSPDHSRSKMPGTDSLFGPPLESAFKSMSFSSRARVQSSFPSSEYAAFSSDSSSPENVEDSGLDSPSHQPQGASPDPAGWAAWPSAPRPKDPATLGCPPDPFLAVFRDPSPGRSTLSSDDPVSAWSSGKRSPRAPPDTDTSTFAFPAFPCVLPPPDLEPSVWSCKHIPPDPFLTAFECPAPQEIRPPAPDAWAPPLPDSFTTPLNDTKTLPPPSSSSRKDRNKRRDRSVPPPDSTDDPFAITMIGSPTHQSTLAATQGVGGGNRSAPAPNPALSAQLKKEAVQWGSVHNPFSGTSRERDATQDWSRKPSRNGLPLTRHSGPQEDLCFSTDKDQDCLDITHPGPQRVFRQDNSECFVLAPPQTVRSKRSSDRLSGCERSRSLCSSPLPELSPPPTSSSSSSPSEWGGHTRATSPARGLSRGPSPVSLGAQEAWPVAAAITEYINAYFKGGEHNRCLVKITGDLTMSFPAGITRIFTANPNIPLLSFRLVNISRVDHFLPNQKLLYSDPSQNDPDSKDFWFNMQALTFHLQREAELNPQASYYNVGVLKYQVSSQDPARAPLLLSAECQRSGTVTRISLDYHCCPATAPATQLTAVQVLLPLDHTATDLQCQPPASWNAEERRLLWKLPNLSPTNHSKGSGTLCASWQCLEVPRGPPPSLAVQFVGCGASLSGMDVELASSRYRMSLVKKRFATGKYMAGCSL
ncbi:F-BAR domain only protein 1 isoform X2 [Electrophorus electricus]|uniref:MHD domain-containing protein n=1 Tax=Electrophorus electricus TaxID=8005 RepID=A0A4W4GJ21_ELEEL|nr:F-BAR domain only protein 1 isoform X2 [Electrophorus electricus]